MSCRQSSLDWSRIMCPCFCGLCGDCCRCLFAAIANYLGIFVRIFSHRTGALLTLKSEGMSRWLAGKLWVVTHNRRSAWDYVKDRKILTKEPLLRFLKSNIFYTGCFHYPVQPLTGAVFPGGSYWAIYPMGQKRVVLFPRAIRYSKSHSNRYTSFLALGIKPCVNNPGFCLAQLSAGTEEAPKISNTT